MAPVDPDGERPVSELVNQLIEDGKSYARAELAVVKAIASDKASALTVPAALFATAFLLLLGGVNALAVGLVLAIAAPLGPLLAGLLAFLIFAAVAGGLAWWAFKRVKADL